MGVFYNGTVFTGEGFTEAFVTDDNKFVATGSSAALLEQYPDVPQHDLGGKFVCAGFNDSHMHVLNDGYALNDLLLAEHTGSLEEMKAYIKDEIQNRHYAPGQWVNGRGWNHDFFSDGRRFPTRYDLDEISEENPICIVRACGHACVVNSKGLEMLGIDKHTEQIEGGRFDVDENGEPLGIFRENALDMVYSKLPQPTREDLKPYYDLIEVRQHSSVLHSPIKWLRESILNKKFSYNENKLLEINFTNCVQVEDTNLNKYLHKKKSKGKIDMVMAMINALYLLQQQVVLGQDNSWSIQIC